MLFRSLVGVARRLLTANGAEARILVGFVELEVARRLSGRPAENNGDVVDERRLGEFAQRVFVVGDVDHCEEDAELVFALEVLDAGVDVLGVQAVVFQTAQSPLDKCHQSINQERLGT